VLAVLSPLAAASEHRLLAAICGKMTRMCGRFTLRTPLAVLSQQSLFDLGPAISLFSERPRYNIAPTQRSSRPTPTSSAARCTTGCR